MAPKTDMGAGEIVYGDGSATHRRGLLRAIEANTLRRIYSSVYTRNMDSPLEAVVLRNWAAIVGFLLPDAVLAYRTAIEHRPAAGVVHVRRGLTRRKVVLPGLIVEVHPGIGGLTNPPDFLNNGLYLASEARGLVENMSTGRGVAAWVMPQTDIEARLEKILTIRGDFKLNDLRDQARDVAEQIGMSRQMKRLDGIIGAMLGTHEKKQLRSRLALARAAGHPYDPDRIVLFDALHAALVSEVFAHPMDRAAKGAALDNFAFFEGYFSNYIEGTTFEVDEAEQIVFQGAIIKNRSEDSHDILGTFQAATTKPWRNSEPSTSTEFVDWLKSVNALVMQARLDKTPGQWKERANQAGNTVFVLPEQVPATLREGFDRIRALADPVARALMTMFVVSEVHPFQDGNGRTARLAMNCVLSSAGLCRIIIPTIYREDYLLPLKRLTNDKDASAYIKTMTRIHHWTSRFDYTLPLHEIRGQLSRCNAFEEDLRNYRLTFPD